jgi:hypothetical protein
VLNINVDSEVDVGTMAELPETTKLETANDTGWASNDSARHAVSKLNNKHRSGANRLRKDVFISAMLSQGTN